MGIVALHFGLFRKLAYRNYVVKFRQSLKNIQGGEPARHQTNHGDVYQRFRGLR